MPAEILETILDAVGNTPLVRLSRLASDTRTQLVAKGHHFPKLNLVGIVDADLGLGSGDPRAAEKSFQLLHQVVGRAGREAGRAGRGRGLIQTHQPDHPVMRALIAADREAFYAAEIAARERSAYPPFGRLASLVVSGPDRPGAEGFARRLAAAAPKSDDVRVLGPAEAPIAVIRGRHRFRLLAKSPRSFDLSDYLRDWLARAPSAAMASTKRSTTRSGRAERPRTRRRRTPPASNSFARSSRITRA